ncbi:hypothetical protein [Vibrio zhanjiangensis]|nr:hypothetical protein [Vibrio zhanjiangensis]
MDTKIQSESEYQKLLKQLVDTYSHPLFGDIPVRGSFEEDEKCFSSIEKKPDEWDELRGSYMGKVGERCHDRSSILV